MPHHIVTNVGLSTPLVLQISEKIWPNCAFNDKSVKFGTKLEHILRNIFRYRAIAGLSRDPSYITFQMTSLMVVLFAVSEMFFLKKRGKAQEKLNINISQTS